MRQAIEEGFILDVLKNYMTYETSYRIAKKTEENPDIPVTQGLRAIRRFESLHPYNLRQNDNYGGALPGTCRTGSRAVPAADEGGHRKLAISEQAKGSDRRR